MIMNKRFVAMTLVNNYAITRCSPHWFDTIEQAQEWIEWIVKEERMAFNPFVIYEINKAI